MNKKDFIDALRYMVKHSKYPLVRKVCMETLKDPKEIERVRNRKVKEQHND